jgi:hypothetical protein
LCAQTVGKVMTVVANVDPISAYTLRKFPQSWPNWVSHGMSGTPLRSTPVLMLSSMGPAQANGVTCPGPNGPRSTRDR